MTQFEFGIHRLGRPRLYRIFGPWIVHRAEGLAGPRDMYEERGAASTSAAKAPGVRASPLVAPCVHVHAHVTCRNSGS